MVEAGSSGSQRRQYDGEGKLQPENKKGQDKHKGRCGERLEQGDPDNLHAAFLQNGELEKFTGRKGYEGKRDVRQEIRTVDDALRHQVETVRTDENACDDISRHIRKAQQLCQPRHQEAGEQHQRYGYNDRGCGLCGFNQLSECMHIAKIT